MAINPQDYNKALKEIFEDGNRIGRFPIEYRDNYDLANAAIRSDEMSIAFLSPRLQDNDVLVMKAVKGNGKALRYASDRLKNDPKIVLAAYENRPIAIFFASPTIKECCKSNNTLATLKEMVEKGIQPNPLTKFLMK